MDKKLIIINGPPGIGKTSTCRELQTLLKRSVWLDGDWCWMSNPWIVTDETKEMAESNMRFLLGNFLKCSEYEYILFSWIFRHNEVFDLILDGLIPNGLRLFKFTLTCAPDAFLKRLQTAGRDESKIPMCMESLQLCESTNSEKIDTTGITAKEAAEILHNKITGKK